MVDVVSANGEGFVNYQWPKPGVDAPQPKVSYVKGYEPWGWIVGSGVYVDDVNAAVMRDGGLLMAAAAVLSHSSAPSLWGEAFYCASHQHRDRSAA